MAFTNEEVIHIEENDDSDPPKKIEFKIIKYSNSYKYNITNDLSINLVKKMLMIDYKTKNLNQIPTLMIKTKNNIYLFSWLFLLKFNAYRSKNLEYLTFMYIPNLLKDCLMINLSKKDIKENEIYYFNDKTFEILNFKTNLFDVY